MDKMPNVDAGLKTLIRLIKGDYNKFLAEQFKKAKRCHHDARAIRISLKQKNREFAKAKTVLDPAAYMALKQPLGWSKEKWQWGSDRDRAAAMMRFQEKHLHAPLTTALARISDPVMLKSTTGTIIHCFDTVQKFMGQRMSRNMDLRLCVCHFG
jgi:hypothetical protein